MKFFIAFVAVIAVAVASPMYKFKPATNELAELEAIIAAIQSPNTDPATAALLEEQLQAIAGVVSPVAVGPAIVEANPISIGAAFIDFPLPDGGVVTADEPTPVVEAAPVLESSPIALPSPVIIGEIPAGSSPLVQIIVNVIQEESAAIVPPAIVEAPVVEEVYVPGPVNVVDNVITPDVVLAPIIVEPTVPGPVNVVDNVVIPDAVIEPVQVAVPVLPGPVNVVESVAEPVQVVEPVIVEPVQVIEPVVIQPVIVGTPIIPAPAVVLPELLN